MSTWSGQALITDFLAHVDLLNERILPGLRFFMIRLTADSSKPHQLCSDIKLRESYALIVTCPLNHSSLPKQSNLLFLLPLCSDRHGGSHQQCYFPVLGRFPASLGRKANHGHGIRRLFCPPPLPYPSDSRPLTISWHSYGERATIFFPQKGSSRQNCTSPIFLGVVIPLTIDFI